MQGIFALKTADDLREKLKRDLEKFKVEPLSTDAAFNFFVTAEHMLDWVHPKRANDKKRKEHREGETLLQICSHLANGAKHFEVESPTHKSVESSCINVLPSHGYFTNYFTGYFTGFFPGSGQSTARLVVNLKDAAVVAKHGQSIGAIELAEKVMAYWMNQDLPPA